MADRFERLFELPNNLFSRGLPMIVSAGALLKDTQTGKVVVQLKYQSVSPVTIKALRVDIIAYDVCGNEIQGKKDYQYLDLSVRNGQTFGSNKAIVMPDATARSFSIGNLNIVLSDGNSITATPPLSELPTPVPLRTSLGNSELVKQYRIATNEKAYNVPREMLGLWVCACGEWNSQQKCSKCNLLKNAAFSSYNLDNLSVALEHRLEAEEHAKREQAEHNAAIERQRKARNRKTVRVISVITLIAVAVSVFAFWLYPDVIKSSIMYNEARQLLSDAKYDDAAVAFNALGDYKDAENMKKEAIFQKGCMLLNAQEFDEAIAIFGVLGNYGNSREKETEAYYQKAIFLKDNGDVEEAIKTFRNLSGYQDSDTQCVELQYDLATDYLTNGQYNDAKTIFESIFAYKDSANLVKECDYQKGCHYLENEQYLEAIEAFGVITDYLDAETRMASAYSLYYLEQGTLLYKEAKFYLAIEMLRKSSEIAASDLITQAENEIMFINNICGGYGLVEKVSWGQAHTIYPANTDSCTISFDFEEGLFVIKSHVYVDKHYFVYSFSKDCRYYFEPYYSGGSGKYYYVLENDRLMWYEDDDNYSFYEKE